MILSSKGLPGPLALFFSRFWESSITAWLTRRPCCTTKFPNPPGAAPIHCQGTPPWSGTTPMRTPLWLLWMVEKAASVVDLTRKRIAAAILALSDKALKLFLCDDVMEKLRVLWYADLVATARAATALQSFSPFLLLLRACLPGETHGGPQLRSPSIV